jgi:TolA-binding protein
MNVVKVNLAAMNVKLKEVVEKLDRNEENVKAVKDDVVAKVHEQLNKQEESNRQLKTDNVGMKKSLNEMSRQLERLTQQTSHEVQVEQHREKKGIAEADGMDRERKVVVTGGWNGETLNSVEMFSLSKATWEPLQPTKDSHHLASSVVYNNQVFVTGGYCDGHAIKSIEKLSMNAVEVDQSITWENCPAA